MKLHLPTALKKALLACFSLAFTLPAAYAADQTISSGETITRNVDLAGSGSLTMIESAGEGSFEVAEDTAYTANTDSLNITEDVNLIEILEKIGLDELLLSGEVGGNTGLRSGDAALVSNAERANTNENTLESGSLGEDSAALGESSSNFNDEALLMLSVDDSDSYTQETLEAGVNSFNESEAEQDAAASLAVTTSESLGFGANATTYSNLREASPAMTSLAQDEVSMASTNTIEVSGGTTTTQSALTAFVTGNSYIISGSATGDELLITSGGNPAYGRFRVELAQVLGFGLTAGDSFSVIKGAEINFQNAYTGSPFEIFNGIKLSFDNGGAYFTAGDITNDIEIGAGGFRLNGASGSTYTFSGAFTGTGIFSHVIGGNGVTYFTGDLSQFAGTWGAATSSARSYYFGNNTSAADTTAGTLGGNIDNATGRIYLAYNDAYTVAGEVNVANLFIQNGGTASFSGNSIAISTLNLADQSNAVFARNATVGSIVSTAGASVTVAGGAELSVTGDVNLGSTISNSGSLVIEGAISVTDLNDLSLSDSKPVYSDAISADTENGYGTGTLLYYIVKGASGTIDIAADSFTALGKTYTITTDGGDAYYEFKTEAGTYYINTTGSYEYEVGASSAKNSLALDSTLALVVNAASTIDLKSDFNAHLASITLNAATTVNLDSALSIAATSLTGRISDLTNLTLAGSGSITGTLAEFAALGTKLQNEGWTGNAVLSGSFNYFDLRTVGNEKSTITLNGVYGYLRQNETYTSNIVFTNDGSTLALDISNGSSNNSTIFSGTISGTGDFRRTTNNAGAQTFTFTGDVSAWTGGFAVQHNGGNSTTVNFTEKATLINVGLSSVSGNTATLTVGITNDNAVTVNSLIERSVIINFDGLGNKTLTAANTYTGATNVNAGSVTLSGSGTLGDGSGAVRLAADTSLIVARDMTLSNDISGDGAFTSNSADVTLSGNNSYTGGTTVLSGTLTLASATALGASSGAVVLNGGNLKLDTGFSGSLSNEISGSGKLISNVDATISSTNTYTGGTDITGGTLTVSVAGALGAGDIHISGGATLKNTAALVTTLTNDLTIGAGGATLSGYSLLTGSLILESLTLDSGGLDFDGAAITFGAGFSLTILGELADGTYTIFSGASDLSAIPTIALIVVPDLTPRQSIVYDYTTTLGSLTAVVTSTAADLTWAGGIDSVWMNETAGGWSGVGSEHGFWTNDHVTFGDTAAAEVTIDGHVSIGTMTVNSSADYSFVAGESGGSITGKGGLIKSGTGTLTLSTVNSYEGGTTINEGTLVMGISGALGSGDIIFAGGTLKYGAGVTDDIISQIKASEISSSNYAKIDLNGNHVTWASTVTHLQLSSDTTASLDLGSSNSIRGAYLNIGSNVTVLSSHTTGYGHANSVNLSGAGTFTFTGGSGTLSISSLAGFTGALNATPEGSSSAMHITTANTEDDRFLLNTGGSSETQAVVLGMGAAWQNATLYLRGLEGSANISTAYTSGVTNRGLNILLDNNYTYSGLFHGDGNRWGTVTVGAVEGNNFTWTVQNITTGSMGTNAALVINSGATVDFAKNDAGTSGGFWADDITVNAGGTLLISRDDSAGFVQRASADNAITGEGKVVVSGNATFNTANTYEGGTTVSGTLNAAAANALGSGKVSINSASTQVQLSTLLLLMQLRAPVRSALMAAHFIAH